MLESTDAIKQAFESHPMSLPIIVFCFIGFLGLSVLVYYHYKISMLNITTHEELKGIFFGFKRHPYQEFGILKNMKNRIFNKHLKYPTFQPLGAVHSNIKEKPGTVS